MKRLLRLLLLSLPLLPLLALSTVHAQPGLGRLFNTPQERQAIDANRGKPATVTVTTTTAAAANPGAMPGAPVDGMPAAMPPEMQAGMMQPGGPPVADSAPPPEQLTMNGVLRSSNGRSTVWLNNQPQRGAVNQFSNRDSKAVTVTLASGKRIVLRPGQRYDLADGRVKDVGQ